MTTLREEVIAQIILARLSEDKRTSGQTIYVNVENSDIYLIGTCDTEEQKRTAKLIAEGMCGIRSVIDNIKVRRIAQAI